MYICKLYALRKRTWPCCRVYCFANRRTYLDVAPELLRNALDIKGGRRYDHLRVGGDVGRVEHAHEVVHLEERKSYRRQQQNYGVRRAVGKVRSKIRSVMLCRTKLAVGRRLHGSTDVSKSRALGALEL